MLTLTLTEQEKYLLQEALAEYRSFRAHGDVQRYLDQRYPLSEGYNAAFREMKRISVTARLVMAAELRERLFATDC